MVGGSSCEPKRRARLVRSFSHYNRTEYGTFARHKLSLDALRRALHREDTCIKGLHGTYSQILNPPDVFISMYVAIPPLVKQYV